MKKNWLFLAALLGVGGLEMRAVSNSASTTLTYTIPLVQSFAVTGTPTFTFLAPTAGQDFSTVTDATSNFAVTSNLGAGKGKITGSLSSTLPTGVSLVVTFAVPSSSGGTNVPNTPMTTTAMTLMTGINNGFYPTANVSYTMTALVGSAAVTSSSTATATYTFLSS